MKKILKSLLFLFIIFSGYIWATSQDEKIEIWGTPVSPYVRKVLSVLEQKQLKYKLHPILPKILLEATQQPVPSEFEEVSPCGKIPALQIESFHTTDSAVIVNFLEKKWPHHPVYPSNAENFAKTLWYEK